MNNLKLGPLFDCPINKIDCTQNDFDGTDISLAIRETKSYLTSEKLSTIIVVRRPNGRFKVRTNVVAFLVAHTLGLLSIPAQEVHSDGSGS